MWQIRSVGLGHCHGPVARYLYVGATNSKSLTGVAAVAATPLWTLEPLVNSGGREVARTRSIYWLALPPKHGVCM